MYWAYCIISALLNVSKVSVILVTWHWGDWLDFFGTPCEHITKREYDCRAACQQVL